MLELETAILTGPCPCDPCPNRQRCAREKLACETFHHWAMRGILADPTEPSRDIYRQLYEPNAPKHQNRNASILKLLAKGWTYEKVAKKFGMSKSMVKRVRQGARQ